MNNNLKNKKKKGFTLIELIIVIAIIAILAVIAIPKFGQIRKDAAFKSDVANAKTIANAASTLYTDGTLVDGTYYVDSDLTTETNGIEGYLQNSPAPKSSTYTMYKVVVASGNVKVTMETAKTNGNSTDLFPVPATSVN